MANTGNGTANIAIRAQARNLSLDLLDRRNWPAALMTSHGNSQSMDIVYKDVVNRPGFAV